MDASAVEPIARALLLVLLFRELGRDKPQGRRVAAAQCLTVICRAEELVPLIDRVDGEADTAVAQQLQECLNRIFVAATVDEQRAILEALGRIADPECVPGLLDFLNVVSDDDIRCKIISMLPAFRDHRVVVPLLKLLIDDNPTTHAAAKKALEQCGDLLEPDSKKFMQLAKAITENKGSASLGDRFFLWRFARRHRELEEVVAMLRQKGRQ